MMGVRGLRDGVARARDNHGGNLAPLCVHKVLQLPDLRSTRLALSTVGLRA